MTRRGYREDIRSEFVNLGILTVPSMYILECLCYFKLNSFNYSTHASLHNHDTRLRNNYKNDFLRLTHSRNSINYYAPVFFNKLPPCLRDIPTEHFRRRIKSVLIQRAYYSLDEYLNDPRL